MGQGYTECAFGTGNALLRYGIGTRCAKQPPAVRDAFSEAFGVKNRLFWNATRFQRGSWGTEDTPNASDVMTLTTIPRKIIPL